MRKEYLSPALLIFLAVSGIYLVSARSLQTPVTSYFDKLAVSFLHGKLYLENPTTVYDLTQYQGRWYLPFLPLPAFMMLPFSLFGKVNTVVFSSILGAANGSLIFMVSRTIQNNIGNSAWMAVLFSVGSVHWYMSTIGSAWFLSQVSTVTFMILSVLMALKGMPLLAGAALGAAMWGRPHVIFLYPLLIGLAWQRLTVSWLILSVVPLLLSGFGILVYNWMRFGNMLDFGYMTESVAGVLQPDLSQYSQFNIRYIPRNLWAMLFALPVWNGAGFTPNEWGMSLLITSPAILYIAKTRTSPAMIGAWVSILLILTPLLMYYNTGWKQFGYRFSLDFMVPVMVLLSYQEVSGIMKSMIVSGCFVNLWGVLWYR